MSATIKFTPTDKGKALPVGGPSNFIKVIERAFGRFPVELSEIDLPKIEGIIAAGGCSDGRA